jgi:hypothetical protein
MTLIFMRKERAFFAGYLTTLAVSRLYFDGIFGTINVTTQFVFEVQWYFISLNMHIKYGWK